MLFFAMLFAAACTKDKNETARVASTQKEEDFSISKKGTISAYNGKASKVVIPDQINGIRVKAIGISAFWGKKLTSVTIPDGVVSIGADAFRFNRLDSVTIPDSVTYIGSLAFANNQLEFVNLSVGLTSIGSEAFYHNYLTTVTIPGSVKSIGDQAFASNRLISVIIPDSVMNIGVAPFEENHLASITIGNNLSLQNWIGDKRPSYSCDSFVGFYNDNGKSAGTYVYRDNRWDIGTALISQKKSNAGAVQYKGDFTINKKGAITDYSGRGVAVVIPYRIGDIPVIAVGDGAFFDKELVSVTMPDTVTSIGANAFAENKITSITIPKDTVYIGDSAFFHNQLTHITMLGDITHIGGQTFANNQLASITIPGSVSFIGPFAFEGNPLTSVTIGADIALRHDSFSRGFVEFYNNNGKKAGTYVYQDGKKEMR